MGPASVLHGAVTPTDAARGKQICIAVSPFPVCAFGRNAVRNHAALHRIAVRLPAPQGGRRMTVSCRTAPAGWLTPGPGAAPPAAAQAEHDVRLSQPQMTQSRWPQDPTHKHSFPSLVDLSDWVLPPCRRSWTPRRRPPALAALPAPPLARRRRRSLPCCWAGHAHGAGCCRASCCRGSPPGRPAPCRCDAGCCSACGGDRPVVCYFCCGGAPCFCSCSCFCRASCPFPCPCHGCAGLDSW